MATAAQLRTELDALDKLSWGYDQAIALLRVEQAAVNAKRKTLETEFQAQDAIEEQARASGG